MAARTITEDNLGAWVIKCDPKSKYDLPRAIEELSLTEITNWSVADNYRSQMMKPRDRVILWVSGDGRRMTRGIWGVGWVVNYVQDTVHEVLDEDEESFWHSEEDRLAVTNDVALDIPLFEEALSSEDIKAAGILDLEVFTQAQASNPSWVSKEQLAALEDLLEEWPEWLEPDERITITDDGAGFGDPVQNAIVEAAAMEAVIDYYRGWSYEDVSSDKVGWDITFRHKPSGQVAHVEVKGVSGDRPSVLLTANEIRTAESDPNWHLAVVTRAVREPVVTEYSAQEAVAAAKPYVYKASFPTP